jgi:anthranilate phosphoribosyltransferase
MDIRDGIARVVEGSDLRETEMVEIMEQIMEGRASDAQIASFITALRIKGETVAEIAGAARVMREKATFIDAGIDTGAGGILMDIVGTGGDGAGTFNVSTTTAFVVAAAGLTVAKHGNRAISSSCGSADVLEALGVDLTLSPELVSRCVREVGIGFLFAPLLHGAMKHAIGPRREIGIRSVFNILGPLTNPARANVQLTGVFAKDLLEPVARVLQRLGMRRTLVVWGEGNMDELTVTGRSYLADGHDGDVTSYSILPEDVGLKRATLEDIKGGADPQAAADLVREVLSGKEGARLDMVLLNAGAALVAGAKVEDLKGGVRLARELISSGAARQKLADLIAFSQASAREH